MSMYGFFKNWFNITTQTSKQKKSDQLDANLDLLNFFKIINLEAICEILHKYVILWMNDYDLILVYTLKSFGK